MATLTRRFPLVLVLAAACAHEQQAAAPAPAPPAVAQPAPPPPPVTELPAPPKTNDDELTRLISEPISHFAFDKALLTSEDRHQLQVLAAALKSNAAARIQIAGNCDERGTEEYDLLLGQKRAAVAKRYLTQLGIAPARLDTISYGEDRPLDQGHNETAWAANRRDDATRLDSAAH
ncbi:MAG TPA: OmpA family protein [Myxococcaceae bacterium]|nr:OmpA family protein [Myxococcaceae bacterium]